MKGGLVAALHAAGAVARTAGARAPYDVVVQAVSSEEDGGLGTFAALERDHDFAAALIPEPTAFGIAAAQAGALTFTGTIPGVTAHAAVRLEGVSAIDRYVLVHQALQEHERRVNATSGHPLLAPLELPYPLLVGRVEGGRWSSQVPDLLTFEGRLGVRVDETRRACRASSSRPSSAPPARRRRSRGPAGSSRRASPIPSCRSSAPSPAPPRDERGAEPPLLGVPYGSDMRLFTARGIPCVMLGAGGLELAHAVDERVSVDELAELARIIVRLLLSDPA